MTYKGGSLDYFGIVKRAYEINLKHKFLWIFGILAGGYGGFRGLSSSDFSGSSADWSNSFNKAFSGTNFNDFWLNYAGIVFSILVFLGVLGLILFILNIISQGALVASVEKISKSEKSNFKISFQSGWHQFWRILWMDIIFALMVLASLVVLIVPIAVLLAAKVYAVAISLGILLFIVCLAFWIILGIISPYALQVVVLEKKPVFQSIREALHLFRDNLANVLIMYLILFAIGLGFGIALVLAIMVVGAILVAIGFGFWLASPYGTVIYGLIAGLAVFLSLIVIGGVYKSFTSSVFTLTYLKLKK